MARESPLEGGSRLFVALLKVHEALLKVREGREVVGSEHLPLDNGEVDFNLVDPASMNRSVNQTGIGAARRDAFNCLLTTMSRAIIHDPKKRAWPIGRARGA